MYIDYNKERSYDGSLEEVFKKLLTVSELRPLYESFFYEVKRIQRRKIVKADMVRAFLSLENTEDGLYLFVKTLPEQTRKAYELLLWRDAMTAGELHEALGFDVVIKESSRNPWCSKSIQVKPQFPFIALFPNYYYTSGVDSCQVGMPPALRKWLKPCFPKPDGYEIKPIANDAFEGERYTLFDASSTIGIDLAQLADFLKRSNPKRTKKGDLTKASIRKAESLTESGEWYPNQHSMPELELLRHAMLLNFIEGFEGSLISKLAAREISADLFKDVFEALQAEEDALEKWLLGHLRHRYSYYGETFNRQAISALFSIFKRLPPDAWVTTDNLKSMQLYQGIDICFFDPSRYQFRFIVEDGKYAFEETHSLDRKYLQEVAINPLIDGMAFLLSAFGFIELAYELPRNEHFKTYKHSYLTPFDGARAVRLTDVGAYAFGLSSTLELEQIHRKVATIRLHPTQLHVTCSELDPITELALKDFMEPVTPEFYRMTRTSFLKGCQRPKDVKKRIADFRDRIGAELPDNWKQFLASLEVEKSALTPETKLKVFTLANRPELQRCFLEEPLLQKLSLRVEGHRIAIAQKDIPAVRTQLRKLGYLIES